MSIAFFINYSKNLGGFMQTAKGYDQIAGDICAALGLKNVISMDIHMEIDKDITIKTLQYVDKVELGNFETAIRKYKIVLAEDDDNG
jgi:hypothetical protein